MSRSIPTLLDSQPNSSLVVGSGNLFGVLGLVPEISQYGSGDEWSPNFPEDSEVDFHKLVSGLIVLNDLTSVAEVGVYRGQLSASIAQSLPDGRDSRLILIDVDNEALDLAQMQVMKSLRNSRKIEKIHLNAIRALSWEASVEVEDESLDLVVLDAAHDYESVSKDFNAWRTKVVPGGFVVIHDTIMWSGARRFSRELFESGIEVLTLATSGFSGASVIRLL